MVEVNREFKLTNLLEDYGEFRKIEAMKGWEVYSNRLEKKVKHLESEMVNNENLPAETLKNMQLIIKGLRVAQRIPKDIESDSKKGVQNAG